MSPLIKLKSSPKQYTLDQDKTRDPQATVKYALEHLKARYDLSNLKIEKPVVVIPGSCQCSVLSDQFATSGKGMTPDQCQASGIMEFAERYAWLHFDYKHYDGFTIKSYREILGQNVPTVDPEYFLSNFIAVQDREKLMAEIPDIPLKWIKGTCLTDETEFYYPINWHNMVFSSNGLASGNTFEESVMQALCEVVERENIYRMFVENRAGNDLDQSSLTNPIIVELLKQSKRYGIEFVIKDITFDLGLPTFIAQGTRKKDQGTLTYQGVGQGTHSDPEKALIRAITEYFEGLALMVKAQKASNFDLLKLIKLVPKQHYGFLALYNPDLLSQRKSVIKLKDIPNVSRSDIKQEVEEAVARLAQKQYKVAVIDKVIEGLGIPGCRVIIPGMRSMISTEIFSPENALSEVCFEAGNIKSAQQHFDAAIEANPVLRRQPLLQRNVRQIYQGDYRDNLLRFGGYKRKGLDTLKSMETSMSGLLKQYKKNA